jgi:hypothetical protein
MFKRAKRRIWHVAPRLWQNRSENGLCLLRQSPAPGRETSAFPAAHLFSPLRSKEFAGFVENIFRDPFKFHSAGIADVSLISRGSPAPRSNAPLNIKEYKEFILPEQDCP